MWTVKRKGADHEIRDEHNELVATVQRAGVEQVMALAPELAKALSDLLAYTAKLTHNRHLDTSQERAVELLGKTGGWKAT